MAKSNSIPPVRSPFFEGQALSQSAQDFFKEKGVSARQVYSRDVDDYRPKIELAIDMDQDGYYDLVKIQGAVEYQIDYIFHRDSRLAKLALRSRALAYEAPVFLQYADPSLFEFLGIKNVYTGDFNGDGKQDFLIEHLNGIHVFYNIGGLLDFNPLPAPKPAEASPVRHIPEYLRHGTLEVGYRGDAQHPMDEVLFEGEFTPSDHGLDLPPDLQALLPARFKLGLKQLSSEAPKSPQRGQLISERLQGYGLKIRKVYGNSWVQDTHEAVLVENKVRPLGLKGKSRAGGDIQSFRISSGAEPETYVTLNEEAIYLKQAEGLIKNRTMDDFQRAHEKLAFELGVDGHRLILLPSVAGFVHLDQQILFYADNQAIAIRLPIDHPDFQKWEAAKGHLKNLGIVITAEIELPIGYLKNARSPLNLIQWQNAQGQTEYIIPVDPTFIYNSKTQRWIDIPHNNGASEANTVYGKEIYFFYDLDHLPEPAEKLRQALIEGGVNPDHIHLEYYHGVGRGGLHCRTNLAPQ